MEKKNSRYFLGVAALLICAIIWGTAFVAQTIGGQTCEPLTFNCARSTVGAIFLILLCPALDLAQGKKYSFWGTEDTKQRHRLLIGGSLAGAFLTFATFMQQWGLMYTTTGKSGFITALYIVLVPILGLFIFRHKVTRNNWLGVLIACAGMYFICITESFSITKGDFITLACPVLFSLQILVIDKFIENLDGVRFSTIQFIVSVLINGLLMLTFEAPTWSQVMSCLGPLLYLGIMSSGIAYTLQIIGQKYVDSVLASMLMSLESVFALLSGWLILNQVMSFREILGCVLVFIAIIIAQLPAKK